jgi:acyl-CoA reductase-like NAD-dependent aldehyde dehydrogenase
MEITREVQETAMLIDGQPRPGRSGKSVEVFNPANGELVGIVPVASEADIDGAVRSSQRAFLRGARRRRRAGRHHDEGRRGRAGK